MQTQTLHATYPQRWRRSGVWLALVIGLSACTTPAAPAPALDTTVAFEHLAQAELPPRPSYRIGINTEITGTGAQLGDLSVRAARLAVEEINAAGGVGGVPLELVVRDSRSSPRTALAQYHAARADDDLDALLGPFKSAHAVKIVPAHQGAALPMLIGATNASLTAQGHHNLFRMRPSDQLTAAAMTALALDRLQSQRVAIIHDADAFGTGGADTIAAKLTGRGRSPVARETYRTGTRDYDALVQRVAATQPDAVLVYATNNTDLGFLLRAMRYWQLDAAIVASPGGATTVARNVAAEAQDGIYVVMDAFLGATPAGARFEQAFQARFGVPPDTYIAWYYDAIHLLAPLLAAHQGDGQALSAALRATEFVGAQGVYRFDKHGEGLHEVVLARMEGGVAQPIARYNGVALLPPPALVFTP